MDKVSSAKEKAAKLAKEVREREQKATGKGKELLEGLFKEGSEGKLEIDPVFEEALLREERTIQPLEKVIEKVRQMEGVGKDKDKNKLRLELAKAIQELQDQKAIDKIDLEVGVR